MKALIDTSNGVERIIEWLKIQGKFHPVKETYENSARVCEVSENTFEVAPGLFWIDCDSEIVADQYYFDTVEEVFLPVLNAEFPQNNESGEIPVTEV